MENESAPPDSLKPSPPVQTRDPLIRYSVFAALGCAAVCMIFTILYVFSYSLDSTLSFERHFDSYIAPANAASLPTLLGLHMAQNRMFLQSCGIVAGIFFAFLGLALLLVGIHGTVEATYDAKDYSATVKRLAPGGIILLASMIFVGFSAMHPIEFVLGPTPPAAILPPTAAPAATPSTQSQVQTTPSPATPQAAYTAPQSAQTQPPPQTTPATAPAQRPNSRLALVNQKASARQSPSQHRFQP